MFWLNRGSYGMYGEIIFAKQRSFCCKCTDTSIVEHYWANRIFARDMYRLCIFLINYGNTSHFEGGLILVQILFIKIKL